MSVEIHPSAIIEKGAELADGVKIGAYSIIGPNVKIGKDSVVSPHAVITGYTTIGERNKFSPFCSVGGPPQDLKYKGEPTELFIGNDNTIREYVSVQPGTIQSTGKTVIGDGNLLMANSHVAHDCVVGDGNIFANSVALAGHVTITNRVILGGLSAIHQFARLGELSFIGGGAMVAKDVPPYAMVQGDRARIVGINLIGLRRAGFGASDVAIVRDFYKKVFLQFGTLESRLASVDSTNIDHPAIQSLMSFAKSSKRGMCSPRHGGEEDSELD